MRSLLQTTIYGKAFKKLETQTASGENREGWTGRRQICIVCPAGTELCFLFTLFNHDSKNVTTVSKQTEKDVAVTSGLGGGESWAGSAMV